MRIKRLKRTFKRMSEGQKLSQKGDQGYKRLHDQSEKEEKNAGSRASKKHKAG